MPTNVLISTAHMPYEEWLRYRDLGIGGSDAAVVCGVSRYKAPIQLWMEKTGQLPHQEAGEAAYWGSCLEPLVKAEFTKRTGIKVRNRKQLLQSAEHPFMLANLDGICKHPTLGTVIFEAKTASAYKADEWDGKIPTEYLYQIQHYMAVTGFAGAYIAALVGGNTFYWRFIERDEAMIAAIIAQESAFWKHMVERTIPEIDGSDAAARFLSERYPESVKSQIALPDDASELLQQYDAACSQIDALSTQKTYVENRLKQMLGENEAGTSGDRLVTWKSYSQERLDSKTLKSEQPEIYQKYARSSSYRRFSIKAAS